MAVELMALPGLDKPDTRHIEPESAKNVEEMVVIMDRVQPEIYDSLGNLASRLWVSTAESSNPPTSAELDAAFGRKEDKRDGFAAWVDSRGTGQLLFLVVCILNKWWYARTLESSGDTAPVVLTTNITTNDRAYFGWDGSTTAISRSGWTVTASELSADAGEAVDGDVLTRWRNTGVTPSMDGDEVFNIDMGASVEIGGIHLLHKNQRYDYPRRWRIDTSPDNVTYTTQLSGDSSDYPDSTSYGGQHSLEAADASHNGLLRFYFNDSVTCRYVRINQLGEASTNWSIHEINAVEPLPDAALHPAGNYTVRYVEGAMQYASHATGQDFALHSWAIRDEGFYVEHSGQGGVIQAPGEVVNDLGVNYDNSTDALATADVEAGSEGDAITFTHTGGTIGVFLFDKVPSDNSANTRSVKFSLGKPSTGGPAMPALRSMPGFIFPSPVFRDDALERFFLELGASFTDNYRNIYQDLFNWTTHIETSLNNVTDGGPTQAELDTAFGTPEQVRTGFTAVVDDAGAKARVWVVAAVNDKWWTLAMTAAA